MAYCFSSFLSLLKDKTDFLFKVSLSTIPSIAVDSQQGQLKLLTLDPNITSSNIVHNKVLITEEDCEANIDYSSNSFGSSYDKVKI